jgi:hypothetical protein
MKDAKKISITLPSRVVDFYWERRHLDGKILPIIFSTEILGCFNLIHHKLSLIYFVGTFVATRMTALPDRY